MTKPLDFVKVEALRKHMLLRGEDMAYLFQVSRMTYYSWVTGKTAIRANNAARVNRVLKQLVEMVKENQWPNPEVLAAGPDERKELLKKAFGRE